ncbi:MAG: hypothetical protein AAGG81_03325, partial [Chlamydiota bacterium]
FNFSFNDHEIDSIRPFLERSPVKLPKIERIYAQPNPIGNNDSFFSEQKKDSINLNYYCTSNDHDRKLIPQEKKVDVESLPKVLTLGFIPN